MKKIYSWVTFFVISIFYCNILHSAEPEYKYCGNWVGEKAGTTIFISCPSGEVELCDNNGCYPGEIEFRSGATGFILYGHELWYGLSVNSSETAMGLSIWDNYGQNVAEPATYLRPSVMDDPSELPCGDQEYGIIFFTERNYKGSCTRTTNNYPNLAEVNEYGLQNDAISSIYVFPGYKVEVYEHANYQGKSETFTSSNINLSNSSIGDDTISSLKIEKISSGGDDYSGGDSSSSSGGCFISILQN